MTNTTEQLKGVIEQFYKEPVRRGAKSAPMYDYIAYGPSKLKQSPSNDQYLDSRRHSYGQTPQQKSSLCKPLVKHLPELHRNKHHVQYFENYLDQNIATPPIFEKHKLAETTREVLPLAFVKQNRHEKVNGWKTKSEVPDTRLE